MKISCQSCQAKYTIADEKVLGKIVKIRCKKCGATIVINGNETGAQVGGGGASAGADPQTFDYAAQPGGGDQWTVNVADGDQRTMTSEEIVGAFKTGVVTEETYCWKDGMGDWLPMREVPELYALAANGPQPALSADETHQEHNPPPVYPTPPPQDDEATAAGYSGYGGGAAASTNGNGVGALFGGGGASPAPPPAAARRQGGRGGGGADLFGGVAHAGGEDDVMTSAPAGMPQPSDDPGKLTGQRNENSVLFSLSALTQNAPKEEAPPAVGEGSGLIDIRALSTSMGNTGGSAKTSHVDDIMNLGGGGAFSAALAAPVLAPPNMDTSSIDLATGHRKDNTKVMLIGIIGAGALIALAIVLVVLLKKPAEPAIAAPTATAAPTETTPAAPAATVAMNDPSAAATAVNPSPGGAAAPGTGQVAAAAPRAAGGGGGGTHKAVHDDNTPSPAPKPFVPPPAPVAGGGGGGGGGSLADALKKSVGGGDTGGGAPAATQSSAPFDRGAAAAALGSINVMGCKKSDGPTGSGHIKVTFSPSGNVTSAVVDQPPFAGTAVGGCVAGKFRSAHIPAFGGSPVPVGKSFVIE